MEVIAVIRDHLQSNENVKTNTAFLEELKNKLPEFFNDEGFDIEKFQNALKENDVNEFSEGYQLNFIGKDYARKQAGDAPTSVIVPDNEHNQKEENKNSKNLFFTGDNLEVLRHLRNNYSNKIDVIYIDPPYNTGNDDFVYPDKFEYSDIQLEEIFGMAEKDISKLDVLKESKSHSAWLTFMYPRLWLAKQLLTDNGVIFISIDDNEQADLKLLMDDIFGENNLISQLIRRTINSGKQDSKKISTYHEYLLVYSTNKNKVNIHKKLKSEEERKKLYPLVDKHVKSRGRYYISQLNKGSLQYSDTLNYPILSPDGTEIWPGKGFDDKTKIFRWSKEKVQWGIENDFITFKKVNQKWKVYAKSYEFRDNNNNEVIPSNPHTSLDFDNKKYSNFNATPTLNKLMDGKYFNFPKPVIFVKEIIQMISSSKSIVLDFFAGSSTTAEAVMQLNAEDGGNRKFIMVQLPEKTYELDKNGNKKPTKGGKAAFDDGYMSIDEISRERIKRAAKKIKDENPDLNEDFDGGFKHYRVVSPEKETLDKIYDFDPERYELVSDMVDSFSSSALGVPGNASGEDTILTTWLAEDGYDFNTDDLVEYDFAGYKAFGIKDTRLYLIDGNLHPEQTKELLNQLGTNKVKFQSIVVYGYSFNVMDMKELERGLSQLNSNVNLIKRY